jgi:hypothetical protein
MERLDKLSDPFKHRDWFTYRARLSPMSHNTSNYLILGQEEKIQRYYPR